MPWVRATKVNWYGSGWIKNKIAGDLLTGDS
jgi:hypothetical protein